MMSWRKIWVLIVAGALLFTAAWHFRGNDEASAMLTAFGIFAWIGPAIKIWDWL
jgi:hypothetical protein